MTKRKGGKRKDSKGYTTRFYEGVVEREIGDEWVEVLFEAEYDFEMGYPASWDEPGADDTVNVYNLVLKDPSQGPLVLTKEELSELEGDIKGYEYAVAQEAYEDWCDMRRAV